MNQETVLMMLVYVSFIIVFEALAQNAFKFCHNNGDKRGFVCGVFFYGAVGFFLMKMYDYQSMGIVNVLWSALSVVAIMLLGHYCWGEKITANDIIGSILVFIGIVCIMMD
ncbi:Putative multidrug transporter EmrE [Yasminevirus sp. GU-2018]|uniref:Multidrug transporter EmrE n=1 Tax=Yasminevirus sp. GU-2018 TaxID=2420051 RepID=A0A5K0UBS8_9VIRU|nr:Putative multidrug transporter EmrE [Yasminevirus sp. GU-2018]